MPDNRKTPRFQSLAHVRFPRLSGGEIILKDLSITGCCVECTDATIVQPDTEYHIEVQPETVSNIGKFELTVMCKWIQSSENSAEIGFFVTASPKGKHFQRYVDYLAYRSQA